MFLKISQISQESTGVGVSLFNKFAGLRTPIQVLSSEICEIFKNIFFHRTPPVAASVFGMKETFDISEAVAQTCSVKKVFLQFLQNSHENTCARISFLIKLQA